MLGFLPSSRSLTRSLDLQILQLLRDHGRLDRSQLAVRLKMMDLPAIDDALHLLSRMQLACPRPDPGFEQLPPEELPWDIPPPFHGLETLDPLPAA